MHARKQIRNAVEEILTAGSEWKAVLCQRIIPGRQIWDFLLVYADGENNAPATIQTPKVYERSLSLMVVAMIKLGADHQAVEDRIDEVSAAVETLLTDTAIRGKLPGKNISISLAGSEFTVVVDEDDNPDHAEIVMNWTVEYLTADGAPETLL